MNDRTTTPTTDVEGSPEPEGVEAPDSDEAASEIDERTAVTDDATASVVTPAPSIPPVDRASPAPRRARLVIRGVNPWSVLKFSLIFYFCVMLVVYLAFWIIYSVASATGSIDDAIGLFADFGIVDRGFEVNQGWVLSRGFAFGIVMVALWSLINVFVAFLYNLISALVGGIEVTLAEKH